MQDSFFKTLNKEETEEFKQWARENYEAGGPINEVWHPVVRAECRKMIEEAMAK